MSWLDPLESKPDTSLVWGSITGSTKSHPLHIQLDDGTETVGFYATHANTKKSYWFILEEEDAVENVMGWKPIPRWIPVPEKLPNHVRYVLTQDTDGYHQIAYYTDGEWLNSCHILITDDVIAYMEIPKYEPPTPA